MLLILFFSKECEFSTVLHGKSNCLDALIFFSKWNKTPLFSNVVETDVRKTSSTIKRFLRCMNILQMK